MFSDEELKKRQRERRAAVFVFFAFLVLTFVLAGLSNRKGNSFLESLGYFAIVNLNVILLLLLIFLVIRNLVKAYVVRRSGRLGGSLRWRMMTSMLAFTLLPSIALFASSTWIIRQGFDRWFGGQVSQALEDAQAITTVHYKKIEEELEFYAHELGKEWQNLKLSPEKKFEKLQRRFPADGVEFYESLVAVPLRSLKEGVQDWEVPRATLESLQRAFEGQSFSLIRQYGDGDLVQRFYALRSESSLRPEGIFVVSQRVPLGLKTRMSELKAAFGSYERTRLLKDSLKTQYTLILLTLFVLIVFVVSWFGLYLARSVTDPVAELMKATEAFREGRWNYRIQNLTENFLPQESKKKEHSLPDLELLKASFNLMAEEVGRRGHQLEEANAQLISLVGDLEERERYLEILLSSIKKGVVVLDLEGKIRRINHEALLFSNFRKRFDSSCQSSREFQSKESVSFALRPEDFLLKNWFDVFSELGDLEENKKWLQQTGRARGRPVDRIFQLDLEGAAGRVALSVRATGIELIDERKNRLGFLILLEDVSDAARLERLAAWQEVARLVAHEIKNPLSPIQISADMLYRKFRDFFPDGSAEKKIFLELVSQIHKNIKVIRDRVKEFTQFAKLPEPRLQPVNILLLLEEIFGDYRMNHPGVHFVLKNESGLGEPYLKSDPEYLRRMIVNLTDNALHAMEEAHVVSPEFQVTLAKPEDPDFQSFLQIRFQDNGPGIPEPLKEKIFDPYVTSKAAGLGLGLAIVRRIALEHGGRIRVGEGPGACFVLELPQADHRLESGKMAGVEQGLEKKEFEKKEFEKREKA